MSWKFTPHDHFTAQKCARKASWGEIRHRWSYPPVSPVNYDIRYLHRCARYYNGGTIVIEVIKYLLMKLEA